VDQKKSRIFYDFLDVREDTFCCFFPGSIRSDVFFLFETRIRSDVFFSFETRIRSDVFFL